MARHIHLDILFVKKIPENTKNVVFCDEEMPAAITEIEDMDADGDGGVVAWTDGETMKVSTQVKVTNMNSMFYQATGFNSFKNR